MTRRGAGVGRPRRRVAVRLVVVVGFVLAVAACSGGKDVARGVVIEVDGDLTTTRSFVLALADGSRLTLVPDDGIRFHDGAPLSHLQEHVVSGQRVEVRYTELDDGTLIALEVDDVP